MTVHSLRSRTLGVIPIRLALGLLLLLAAGLPALRAPALYWRSSREWSRSRSCCSTTLARASCPLARSLSRSRRTPRSRRSGARRSRRRCPSTVGLAVLALITLVPQPTLTALLAGVCAGLGVAAALSLPRIDPDLYVDPRTEILYRR